jgi:hypothetical protein
MSILLPERRGIRRLPRFTERVLIFRSIVSVHMGRGIQLKDVLTVLDEIEYPIERAVAAEQFSDVTLILADGEANLAELISESTNETFESAADVQTELHNVLPRGAVGEPNQSEGDA